MHDFVIRSQMALEITLPLLGQRTTAERRNHVFTDPKLHALMYMVGYSAAFAAHPERFPFAAVIGLIPRDGMGTACELPAENEEVGKWVADRVAQTQAERAVVTFCCLPGRSEPGGSPNGPETINVALLWAGEEPLGITGHLRRDTTPARIDWERDFARLYTPLLDAVQDALDDHRRGTGARSRRRQSASAGAAVQA